MASEGEIIIAEWLDEYGITYDKEKTFSALPGHRFDFYLPNSRIVIEYDGEQHFEPIEMFGGEAGLIERQAKDARKNEFCISQGIKI